jgi:CheY-like chemotaxis protein
MARLLVVDDDDDVLHLVWTQMRARGHQVLGAASGPEALEAVQLWGPPQVAVLDVAMPAIFLSARVDRRTVEAALAGGYEGLQMAVEQAQQRPPCP